MAIVPTHWKKKRTIEDCLVNLDRQIVEDGRPFELSTIVLINNSSKKFRRKVYDIIYSQENDFTGFDLGKIRGTLARKFARVVNYGYDIAKGEKYDYTIVVGADVMLPNLGISYMLEAFDDNPRAGLVCLHCTYRAPKIGPVPMVIPLFEKGQVSNQEYLASKYYEALAGNGAMMTPRKVFSRLPWRESGHNKPGYKGLKWGGDYQYCIDVKELLGLKVIIRTDLETIHLEEDGKTMCYSGMDLK